MRAPNKYPKVSPEIRKTAKGAGLTLLGGGIGAALDLAGQVLLARFLGMGGLGLYSLGMATVRISEVFARLGIPLGGTRLVSIYKGKDPRRLKGVLISSTGACLLSGCLAGFMLWLLAGDIAQRIFQDSQMAQVLRALAPAVPCVTLLAVSSSLLTGFHTTKFTVLSRNLIEPGANLGLVALFLILGQGLKGVIWAFIASNALAAVFALRFMLLLFPGLRDRSLEPVYDLGELMGNSVPILLIGMLNYLLSWTDTLMLGMLGSSEAVGLYRASSRIPLLLPLVLNATNSIYGPLAASLHAEGKRERLSQVLKTTTHWVTYCTVPAFLVMLLGAEELMGLFGKEFTHGGKVVMAILGLGSLVNSVTGGTGLTLIMVGKQNVQLCITVACVGLNILLNLFLIPSHGAIGAAIATSTSISAVNIFKVVVLWRILKLHPFSSRSLGFIGLALGLCCIFLGMGDLWLILGPWSLPVRLLLVAAVLGFFLKRWGLDREDKMLWEQLLYKLSGRRRSG